MPDEIVHIVDDDVHVRESLLRLFASDGICAEAHHSAKDLFVRLDPNAVTCILLDVRLAEQSGLDVQQALAESGRDYPVVFMTGFGTIPLTVRAMRAGALEFLTKPLDDEVLLATVRAALAQDAAAVSARSDRVDLRQRLASLTPRENEAMALIIGGLMNKQVAAELGTSEITAKVHKRHIMEKMGARSLADLVQMAGLLDIVAARRR